MIYRVGKGESVEKPSNVSCVILNGVKNPINSIYYRLRFFPRQWFDSAHHKRRGQNDIFRQGQGFLTPVPTCGLVHLTLPWRLPSREGKVPSPRRVYHTIHPWGRGKGEGNILLVNEHRVCSPHQSI